MHSFKLQWNFFIYFNHFSKPNAKLRVFLSIFRRFSVLLSIDTTRVNCPEATLRDLSCQVLIKLGQLRGTFYRFLH